NYAPGYYGDGTVNTGEFVLPPSPQRSITDVLLENNVSWKYYGEGWNLYLQDPTNYNLGRYCDICNPFHYQTSVMTNEPVRANNLKDLTAFYNDVDSGPLPAVSFIKPDGLLDGHPTSSKLDLFEGFLKKIVEKVQSQPRVWNSTAIVVTMDEG